VHAALGKARRRVAEMFRPREKLRISEWADRYRVLSPMSSPEPGPWRSRRVPFSDEVMQCAHPDDPTEWVVYRTGTQISKTETLLCILFFYMHQYPRSIAYVLPNEQACVDVSVQRIDDGIKASPALRKLVKDQHGKDAEGRRGKDAVLSKKFPGGILFMLNARSPSALASKPCGVLLLDEINRMPRELDGEPDPIGIVEHRSQNYIERKIYLVSTPTDEGDSPIDDWYEKTTKEIHEVPCPFCGAFQALNFWKVPGVLGGVIWPEGRPDLAKYECAHCGEAIDHDRKAAMLAAGRWRATVETPTLPRSRGFHLSSLYSPFGRVTWGALATKFVAAKHDPVKMRDFVTLDLAEAFRPETSVDPNDLEARRAAGWGAGQPIEVPEWVQVLTSFVDVQDDRLEISVWGWDASEHGCLVGHWILWGDAPAKGAPVWTECARLLNSSFRTPRGMLSIAAGGVDSGAGKHADTVYWFIRSNRLQARRQFATKGLSTTGVDTNTPIWPQVVARHKGRATVVPMNVGLAKYQLSLRIVKPEFVRFPKATTSGLHADYLAQICAEELVRVRNPRTGVTVRTWRLKKGVDRNEALDCMVGAYAAMKGLNRAAFPAPCGVRTDLPSTAPTFPAPAAAHEPPPLTAYGDGVRVDTPPPPPKAEAVAPQRPKAPAPQSDYWANRRPSWRNRGLGF